MNVAGWSYPHPTHGTCVSWCERYGACHCSPTCLVRPRIAEPNRPLGRVGGRPYVFAWGHCTRLRSEDQSRVGHETIHFPHDTLLEAERLRPLVDWLVDYYGTQVAVAHFIHLDRSTVGRIHRGRRATPDSARKIVAGVLALQPEERPHVPRPPLDPEQEASRRELVAQRRANDREKQRRRRARVSA